MPQWPIFREGVHLITAILGYQREGDEIVYLHGMMPAFHLCAELTATGTIYPGAYLPVAVRDGRCRLLRPGVRSPPPPT